jgi:hypothetical protein
MLPILADYRPRQHDNAEDHSMLSRLVMALRQIVLEFVDIYKQVPQNLR